MSKLTSDDLVRAALWEAYGKRCFWHGEPIAFAELEVDHLIPESLEKKPLELKKILKSASLPTDYDLQGLQNLVPSCGTCNGKKSAEVYKIPRLISLVQLVERTLPKVNKLIKPKKAKLSFEETYINAVRAEKTGDWKISDLVAKFRENGHIEFGVSRPPRSHRPPHLPSSDCESPSADSTNVENSLGRPVFLTSVAFDDLRAIHMPWEEFEYRLTEGKEEHTEIAGVKLIVSRIDDYKRLHVFYSVGDKNIRLLRCLIINKKSL